LLIIILSPLRFIRIGENLFLYLHPICFYFQADGKVVELGGEHGVDSLNILRGPVRNNDQFSI
jgi:hypothetical protein